MWAELVLCEMESLFIAAHFLVNWLNGFSWLPAALPPSGGPLEFRLQAAGRAAERGTAASGPDPARATAGNEGKPVDAGGAWS